MKITIKEMLVILFMTLAAFALVCPYYGMDIRILGAGTMLVGGLLVFYLILN